MMERINMSRTEISKKIKGLKKDVTIKLGRYYDDVFLADTKGNILVRSINEADFLYLLDYLKK